MKCLSCECFILIFFQCPEVNGTPVTGYTLEWMEDGTFVEVHVLYMCIICFCLTLAVSRSLRVYYLITCNIDRTHS